MNTIIMSFYKFLELFDLGENIPEYFQVPLLDHYLCILEFSHKVWEIRERISFFHAVSITACRVGSLSHIDSKRKVWFLFGLVLIYLSKIGLWS